MAWAGGTLPEQEDEAFTPWPDDAAASEVQALGVTREAVDPLPETALPPAEPLGPPTRSEAEVVALPCHETHLGSAEGWRADFDERAGIAEFDGGLTRPEAEALAHEGCVAEWLDQNPARSPPDRCVHCSRPDRPGDVLLPVAAGSAWVHDRCWEPWYAARRAAAVAALRAMGIARQEDPIAEVIPLPGRGGRVVRDRSPGGVHPPAGRGSHGRIVGPPGRRHA